MPPGAWLLLAIFGLAALQSAASLVVYRPGRAGENVFSTPEADATHLLMNAVMAVMVTPAYAATGRAGSIVLLAVAALGVALALLRHRPGARSPGPLSFRAYTAAAAYHVLMLAAMIYALSLMSPSMGPMCSPGMGAMKPMIGAAHRWLSLPHALAVLFALDAATGTVAVIALPHQLLAAETATGAPLVRAEPTRSSRHVRDLRIGFIPHLVMDSGMVWMLFMS